MNNKDENNKEKEIKLLMNEIEKEKNISIDNFNKLRNFSIKGFGKNSNEIQFLILKIFYQMSLKIKLYSKHISKNFNKRIIPKNNGEKELIIVERDLPRCIYYQYKKNNKNITLDLDKLKQYLTNFLTEKNHKEIYSYYQGFLDLSIYIYLINKTNLENDFKNNLLIFTELYLKDFITPSISNDSDDVFNNCVQLIAEIINLIDKNIGKFFYEDKVPLTLFISWAITTFSHDIYNFDVFQRIFEFILLNEPISSFFITAYIIVNHLKKFSEEEILDEGIICKLKEIELNKFKIEEFNNIFEQSYDFIEKNIYKINLIQAKFKNKLPLICDPNYQGSKSLVYLANNVKLKKRFKVKKINYFNLIFVNIIVVIIIAYLIYFHIYKK
jgi:hypothetical protein